MKLEILERKLLATSRWALKLVDEDNKPVVLETGDLFRDQAGVVFRAMPKKPEHEGWTLIKPTNDRQKDGPSKDWIETLPGLE